MATTIVRWGSSQGIKLPKLLLDYLSLRDNDLVDVYTENDTIIIKKSINHKSKSLKQRLEDFHGKDIELILKEADKNPEPPVMVDWGKPVGEEIW